MSSLMRNKLHYQFVQSFTCEDASTMTWTYDLLMDWTETSTHIGLAFQHAIAMAQHVSIPICMCLHWYDWVMSELPSAVYEHEYQDGAEVYHRDMPIIQDYDTHEKSWFMLNGFLNVIVQSLSPSTFQLGPPAVTQALQFSGLTEIIKKNTRKELLEKKLL